MHSTTTSSSTSTMTDDAMSSETTSAGSDARGLHRYRRLLQRQLHGHRGRERQQQRATGIPTDEDQSTSSLSTSSYQDSYNNKPAMIKTLSYNNTMHSTTTSSSTSTMTDDAMSSETTSARLGHTGTTPIPASSFDGNYTDIGVESGNSSGHGIPPTRTRAPAA